jgi:hypothetical protein
MKIGLNIVKMEDHNKDNDFQDCVLTVHHAYMHTFAQSSALKIVENHMGIASVQHQAAPPQGINFRLQ